MLAKLTFLLKEILKRTLPYRLQTEVHRVFITKFFNANYKSSSIEARQIIKDLSRKKITKVLIVYDNLTVPPSYGDNFLVVMFARFFVSLGIEVDFIIVDGEYREDWNHLDKSEINDLMSDYLDTANLLLDPKLSNIEILSHQQLAIRIENSNKTDTYIPFEDAVINRLEIYSYMLNTLNILYSKLHNVQKREFLITYEELEKKIIFRKLKTPYIAWHIRYSEKWGFDRNLTESEFFKIYEILQTLHPNHIIMIISDKVGCDYFREISKRSDMDCYFSKDFSETILGDGALILGSDYYFALRGGGISVFPIFSKIPYEQIVAPTNQTLWKHEKLTSWSTEKQFFKRPHVKKKNLPTFNGFN